MDAYGLRMACVFVHSEALKNAVFCGTLEVPILLRQMELFQNMVPL